MAQRDENGRFLPGQSGNPGGRPRSGKSLTEVIRRRVDPVWICDQVADLAENSHSEVTRLAALKMLAEAAYQKPAQQVEVGRPNEFEELGEDELQALEERTLEELRQAGEAVAIGPGVDLLPANTGEGK